MQQFLLALVIVLGISSYWLYTENQTLTANNMKLETAVEEQKQTMETMKAAYEKQGQSLLQLSARNAQIEKEKNEYLDIFRRHNLDKLAEAKPGMVETRINNGTKAVFESIENDSKELSDLNNN
tara:strand:+ start:352 stop:723 length:372 start_codon:yes stop_codon:yes gene_type:complete